jgi:Bacterial Ig-like domain (group 3)/Divergent InlB B-repeat domain
MRVCSFSCRTTVSPANIAMRLLRRSSCVQVRRVVDLVGRRVQTSLLQRLIWGQEEAGEVTPFRFLGRWRALLRVVVVGVLCLVLAGVVAGSSRAGAAPNRLDDNRGNGFTIAGEVLIQAAVSALCPIPGFCGVNVGARVESHPNVFDVYWDDNWDADNPNSPTVGQIDNMVSTLAGSSYLDPASQYGVSRGSLIGSHQATACGGRPSGSVSFTDLLAYITCEVQVPFTGVPYPDDNTEYALFLPEGTTVSGAIGANCQPGGAAAFHAWSAAFTITFITIFGIPTPIPQLTLEGYPFTVVPASCALTNTGTPIHNVLDGTSELFSHEFAEASLDPFPPTGWIDDSQFDINNLPQVFSTGEPADICEQSSKLQPTTPVRMTDGLVVGTYWSNADNACVPFGASFHLDETGLPGTVAHTATVNGQAETLPFDDQFEVGTNVSYSFPTPVNDPSPGTRYVTSEPPAAFVFTAAFSKTAQYTTQHFLTVQTAPASVAALDTTLTPSAWENAGTTVPLSTDALVVAGPGNCFRFDHWSGDASGTSTTTSVVMNAPKTAVANYVSGCPTTTTVTSSPNPSLFGQAVSFTAAVTAPPGAGTPNGSVTFFDGANQLTTDTLTAAGTATLKIAALQGGSHTITAVYSGNANFLASSGMVTQNVTFTSCVTSTRAGPLTVHSGEAVCITGMAIGPVTVDLGGALSVNGGRVTGRITATGATALSVCAATVTGGITASGTSGLLLIGDDGDDGTPGCAANTITGPVTLTGNQEGLELGGNTIRGPVTLQNNTGTGPIPENGVFPPPEIEGNQIVGPLRCDGNTPPPIDDGLPNTVVGPRVGQCGATNF